MSAAQQKRAVMFYLFPTEETSISIFWMSFQSWRRCTGGRGKQVRHSLALTCTYSRILTASSADYGFEMGTQQRCLHVINNSLDILHHSDSFDSSPVDEPRPQTADFQRSRNHSVHMKAARCYYGRWRDGNMYFIHGRDKASHNI